jgi:catalase (peroxidase I)
MLPNSLVNTVLEPIWQANCDKISRADFWVLFAILSIQAAEPTNTISFKYQYGRKDTTSCNAGAGRLPSAQGGFGSLYKFFVQQMGLTMADAVALLGGHTIGHVHPDINGSGYGFPGDATEDILMNAWDVTPAIFDNNYYNSIINVVG